MRSAIYYRRVNCGDRRREGSNFGGIDRQPGVWGGSQRGPGAEASSGVQGRSPLWGFGGEARKEILQKTAYNLPLFMHIKY